VDAPLLLTVVVVSMALLVVGLIALSRWARARNAELKQGGAPASAMGATRVLRESAPRMYAKLLFFGDSTTFEQVLGRFLAIVVILFVVAFFAWLGVMHILRG